MSKLMTLLLILVFSQTVAAVTATYGWEGSATVLALEGTGTPPMNVAIDTDPVHSGSQSLYLEDNSPSGTPEAYVAWIIGLEDGDEVTATFWRYDTTPAASPSCRIWAHWNDDPADLMADDGSASGESSYGPGTGWDQTGYTWTVADGHTGLVIEIRTYSNPGDIVWVDDLEVTAPSGTTIWLPDTYTAVETSTWAGIKNLFE